MPRQKKQKFTKKKATEAARIKEGKKNMLKILLANAGNISIAVKSANISRATHYRWMEEDQEYKQGVEDMNEGLLDFAEGRLLKAMNDDNMTAVIFFLKTKGKQRGYVERQEIDSKSEVSVNGELKMTEIVKAIKEKPKE